jgi:hypothetical protein
VCGEPHLAHDTKWNPSATKEIILDLLAKSAASTPQQRAVLVRCPKNFFVAHMVTCSGQLLNMIINANHNINCTKFAEILQKISYHWYQLWKLDIYFCLPACRYENCKPQWSKKEGLRMGEAARRCALRIPMDEKALVSEVLTQHAWYSLAPDTVACPY